MTSVLRVAMIGLGGVAQAHLQAFDLLPESLELVSVCDVRAEAAVEVADKFSAQAYSDYKALLAGAEVVDLVMVLTPASTHRAIVEATAAAGLPVFCEKPIAVTMEDAEAMVEACAKAAVPLFYGSCYRYLPAVVKARELIQAGAIGEVQLLTEQLVGGNGADCYRELAPIHYPLGGPGGPGMGMVDHGVHLIDVFPWITGTEIVSASGHGHISGEPATTETMRMQLSNGAVGHLLYNAATFSTGLPNEGMFSGGQGYKMILQWRMLGVGRMSLARSLCMARRVRCEFFTIPMRCLLIRVRVRNRWRCLAVRPSGILRLSWRILLMRWLTSVRQALLARMVLRRWMRCWRSTDESAARAYFDL